MNYMLRNLLTLFFVLIVQISFAQDLTVTGTVTDNDGIVLPGASIQIRGTKQGTQTDLSGNFSIKAIKGDVLVISFLGMATQEKTITSSTLNISLKEEATELEGVVVTALGIKREKKSLGYASQEIKGSVISEGGQSNALSALSGNISGLQVTAPSSMGGSARLVLRGIGSITGENRPLIVVDGIPLDNGNYANAEMNRGAGGRDYGDSSADINPDDIESITVLKGGPASALYGSRAGNGAILYTTKSAKNGKSEITFSSGITMESISIMPHLQDKYGGGSDNAFLTQEIDGKTYNIPDYKTDESWGPKFDGTLYLPWYAFDKEFPNDYMKPVPWEASKKGVKSFYRTGITRNNSISIAKSYSDNNIRLSFANNYTEGIIPNSNLSKNTFNINGNTVLFDKLKAEAMVTYVQTKGFNRPTVGYGDNSVSRDLFQWNQRQLNFDKLKDYKLANGDQRTWNRKRWDKPEPAYQDNPYWTVYRNTSEDIRNRYYGNAKLTYNFTPYLYAVGSVYSDGYNLRITERVSMNSQAQSKYSIVNRTVMDMNYEARLHFDKNLDAFSINAFVGTNRRDFKYTLLSSETIGGLVIDDLFTTQNGINLPLGYNREANKRTNSIYGFVSFGYKDTYFIEGTNRNDWFSTTKKPVNYSSITGSFIFSNLINADWLNFGKLRAGWAQAGNDTDPYKLKDYKIIYSSFNGSPSYSNSNTLNNPNLIPELKTTKEIGLEARLFKDRIGFEVSYYNTVSKNLITNLEVDGSTGYRYKVINTAEIENKGIEATVNINPVRTKDFSWDIAWNFSKNNNTLTNLYEDNEQTVESLTLATAPFQVKLMAIKGEAYGQIYGTDFEYDKNGKKEIDEDGMYKKSEIKSLGTITPDYNMGIRNSFKYKRINLSFLIDVQKGGNYFSTTHMFGTYSGMLENTVANDIRENDLILDGVKEDGSVNDIKVSARDWAAGHYGGVDKQNVFAADYVKLREVTLGYNLPTDYLGPFRGIQISAFARNLFAWGLDWEGMDPEMASYGSGNVQGIEGGSAPSTRTYGMNVQFKF